MFGSMFGMWTYNVMWVWSAGLGVFDLASLAFLELVLFDNHICVVLHVSEKVWQVCVCELGVCTARCNCWATNIRGSKESVRYGNSNRSASTSR